METGGEFPCNECGKSFGRRPYLNRHIARVHTKKATTSTTTEEQVIVTEAIMAFTCQICNRNFSSDQNLLHHLLEAHEQPSYIQCEMCPRKFESLQVLMDHVRVEHGLTNAPMTIGFKIDNGPAPAQIHQQPAQMQIQVQAPQIVMRNGLLPQHPHPDVVQHHQQQEQQQQQQQQQAQEQDGTSTKSSRKKKKRESNGGHHQQIRPVAGDDRKDRGSFQCGFCEKVYGYKRNLLHHVKLVHEKSLNIYCDICNKNFTSTSNLKSHVRNIHDKIKPFPCTMCGAEFSRKNQLADHMKTTHGIAPPETTKVSVVVSQPVQTVQVTTATQFNQSGQQNTSLLNIPFPRVVEQPNAGLLNIPLPQIPTNFAFSGQLQNHAQQPQ